MKLDIEERRKNYDMYPKTSTTQPDDDLAKYNQTLILSYPNYLLDRSAHPFQSVCLLINTYTIRHSPTETACGIITALDQWLQTLNERTSGHCSTTKLRWVNRYQPTTNNGVVSGLTKTNMTHNLKLSCIYGSQNSNQVSPSFSKSGHMCTNRLIR